jgi:hypothetical protein
MSVGCECSLSWQDNSRSVHLRWPPLWNYHLRGLSHHYTRMSLDLATPVLRSDVAAPVFAVDVAAPALGTDLLVPR